MPVATTAMASWRTRGFGVSWKSAILIIDSRVLALFNYSGTHPNHMTDSHKSHRAPLLRVQAQLQKNNIRKALQLCSKACQADKQDAESWIMLASIHAQLGNLDDVVKCCRHVISLQPENVNAVYNLGVALQTQGKTAEANEQFQRAVHLQPSYVQAHMSLAETFQQLNRLEDAAVSFQHAININPGMAKPHFCLAQLRYLQGNYEEAVAGYHKVLRIDPNHVPTINNLGRVYEVAGNSGKAIELFQKALGLSQDKGITYCNLGRVYFNLKNLAASEAAYLDALKADPNNPEPHIYLGQIYLELGKTGHATAAFQHALKIDPAQRDANYFLAILKDSKFSSGAKTEYVSGLFDDYADKFDKELVEKLQYRTPQLIADAIKTDFPASAKQYDILDAGCGTGLCGPLLRDIASTLDGVDLSAKMIDKARAKGVYDKLVVGELTESLLATKDAYDIIIAADVFVYIGDLADVFRAAHTSLRRGGLFVFSTETIAGDSFAMRPSGRFAHSPDYITGLAAGTGFRMASRQDCALRKEGTSLIEGTIYMLLKDGDNTHQARTA